MLKIFSRFASIGVINTALHWSVFTLLYLGDHSQALSNLLAFGVAVTFSFFANAKWTFQTQATLPRYMAFVLFMGILSWCTGKASDSAGWSPLITLICFSATSLIAGFMYSHFCVFRSRS